MAQAKNGDMVTVHYTGKLEDGTVFDTSVGSDPLQFTIGEGEIIPGFEEAVIGMNPGDSITTSVLSDDAYGPHRAELVMVIGQEEFPPEIQPEVDQVLQMRQPDGQVIVLTVTAVSEQDVTLDANHPLAGKDLVFDIELVEIG